jgi:hypothetical protein
MWHRQYSLVKILLWVLLPTALLAEETPYDGGQFQILLPKGFVSQQTLERDGFATHVFILTVENKLASMIQVSTFPPNPDLEFESPDDIRQACVRGLNQHFMSLKRQRSNFDNSEPEDVEIDGLVGVRATWTTDFEGSGLMPKLTEKGVLYVVADELGFVSIRATGDGRSFDTITLRATRAIETMTIDRPNREVR